MRHKLHAKDSKGNIALELAKTFDNLLIGAYLESHMRN